MAKLAFIASLPVNVFTGAGTAPLLDNGGAVLDTILGP
jgi:hypothetical protein